MKMKIEEGQLKFPPISELPDGFDLFFQRRSLRRTYQYEFEKEKFTLTVCKDQAKEVNPDQTDVCSFNETEAKVLLNHTDYRVCTNMHYSSSPSGSVLYLFINSVFVRSQLTGDPSSR